MDWKTYLVPKTDSVQIPNYDVVCRNGKLYPKFHIEIQGATNKTLLKKENKTGSHILPNFKTYHKATIKKKVALT